MSYAVKIGTIEAVWIADAATPAGHVRYEGALPARPIWDAGLNNIRQMTAQEIAALPTTTQQAKTDASASITSGDTANGSALEKALVAVVLATRDEFNRMRSMIPYRVVSITRSGTVATVTTSEPHGLSAGSPFTIMGADQNAYNATATAATVPNATSWTVNGVAGNPTTPATGSILWTRAPVSALPDITDQQLRDAITAKIAAMAE